MYATIQTPTSDLAKSIQFYTQLQFKVRTQGNAQVTDGQVHIEINPERYARVGLRLYQKSWASLRNRLATTTPLLPLKEEAGHVLSDPNGVRIYLIERTPPSLSVEITSAIPGTFSGISIETTDLSSTMDFWIKLGYQQTQGSEQQGWLTLSNDTAIDVSIMKAGTCPHLFFNPSLTYFNSGNNLSVIQNIRNADIPITEEITVFNEEGIVDNVIIRDPGGLGFFIFND